MTRFGGSSGLSLLPSSISRLAFHHIQTCIPPWPDLLLMLWIYTVHKHAGGIHVDGERADGDGIGI